MRFLQYIYDKLISKRNLERYNVTKLRWEKAELERKLGKMKNESMTDTK